MYYLHSSPSAGAPSAGASPSAARESRRAGAGRRALRRWISGSCQWQQEMPKKHGRRGWKCSRKDSCMLCGRAVIVRGEQAAVRSGCKRSRASSRESQASESRKRSGARQIRAAHSTELRATRKEASHLRRHRALGGSNLDRKESCGHTLR